MFEPATFLIAAIFLPLIGATMANIFSTKPVIRDILGILFAVATAYLVFMIAGKVSASELVEARLFQIMPGIQLAFSAEPLGLVYAGIASTLWIVTIIYSIGYLRATNDYKQTRFFIFLAISISAAIGIAFAANLVTMLIFYEVLTIATYPLVTHKANEKSLKAGRKYLLYLVGSSIALFIPAIIITNIQGGQEFMRGGVFSNGLSQAATIALLLMFVYGIGKAAVMPMHKWLPAAMVAPAPVSALLHAVAVVKAGVFCIVKIITYIFGLELLTASSFDILTYISAFTILCAGIMALKQHDLKAMLAYSTISQLSYIIFAASIYTPAAINAASVHIVAHAVAKITLFFCAGAIIVISKHEDMRNMNGIGRKMPLIMACFLLASLSIIGLPFLPGGESKEMIIAAASGTNKLIMAKVILYASMALSAVYYLKFVWITFAKQPDIADRFKTPLTMNIAIIATTALVLGFNFYLPYIPR